LGTASAAVAVLDFYSTELARRGWRRDDQAIIRGTGEDAAHGWTNGRLIFRLGFKKANDPRNPARGQYPTVYSIDLFAAPTS
jgi:hypothetical protein